ncbi:MAG: hypothetical protein S0880_23030 [Actinomycetota bacterium]|nr:hypothetical protein [Actinomycetota bacterium]
MMRFVDDPSGLSEVVRTVDQLADDPYLPPPFDQDHPDRPSIYRIVDGSDRNHRVVDVGRYGLLYRIKPADRTVVIEEVTRDSSSA